MFPLLSSAYLAPVQWYAKLFQSNGCWMEQHDHFIKQTYRNRCIIATANGPQALTIPIERPSGEQASRMAMKDIRISDHGNWRHIHWQAIVSAYNESPFFEYYAVTFPTFQDFRDTIVPKNPPHDPDFTPRPYYQVFAQRHGFLPNLSVIDLLFNMGNEAPLYL